MMCGSSVHYFLQMTAAREQVASMHNTSLGLPLVVSTCSHLANVVKSLDWAEKKEEYLHYVSLLCKDIQASSVHSASLEHLPVLRHWTREAPDMIRTNLAMQVEIVRRRARNGNPRARGMELTYVAIEYVQKALVADSPRKSKALPL